MAIARTVPAELAIERLPIDPEEAGRLGLVPVGLLQDTRDVARFERIPGGEGIVLEARLARGGHVEVREEIRLRDVVVARERDRRLDPVLQLAHVPREAVGEEGARRA